VLEHREVDLVVDEVRVATVTLNRPSRLNAASPSLIDQLCGVLEDLVREEAARVVIINGRGRSFCSGFDLKDDGGTDSVQEHRARLERMQRITTVVRSAPIPVICQVQGYALGIGCEIAMACDLVIAEEDAVFGFPEVQVGLSIGNGISRYLPAVVGPARAKQLVLLSQRFTAREAHAWGLVNDVVASGMGIAAARELARELAGLPQEALQIAKHMLNQGFDSTTEVALATEVDAAIQLRGSSVRRLSMDDVKALRATTGNSGVQ
jgi:2-(1,2-epoxy-1,2-dihydrophenyl)acetyl-CoA isomerase